MANEQPKSTNRLSLAAGVITLCTALVGLAGAGIAYLSRTDARSDEPAAVVAEPLDENAIEGIDQSGLDGDVPELIDGYMSGPAFIDLWADNPMCFEYEADTQTCQAVSRLTQRGRREVRSLQEFSYRLRNPVFNPLETLIIDDMAARERPRPVAYYVSNTSDYLITREGICTTNDHQAETAHLTVVVASTDETFQDSAPLSPTALAAYREQQAANYRDSAVGTAICHRFKRVRGEPDLIDQYMFIDGILQPTLTMRLRVSPETNIRLRLPD